MATIMQQTLYTPTLGQCNSDRATGCFHKCTRGRGGKIKSLAEVTQPMIIWKGKIMLHNSVLRMCMVIFNLLEYIALHAVMH